MKLAYLFVIALFISGATASGASSAVSGQSQVVPGTSAAGTTGTGGSLSLTSPDSNAAVSVIDRWSRHFHYVAQNGTAIPAPTCSAGGLGTVVVTPVKFAVGSTSTVSVGATGKGPWTAYIRDGSGAAISAAQVIAETYCAY